MSDHNVHVDRFWSTGKLDLLDCFETKFSINGRVDVIGAFEVARTAASISLSVNVNKAKPHIICQLDVLSFPHKITHLLCHVLNQHPCIASSLRSRLGSNIDEIPRVVVEVTEDLSLRTMQQWQKFVLEAAFALVG